MMILNDDDESRISNLEAGRCAWVCARAWVRARTVCAMRCARCGGRESPISNLESRISNLESRHRTVVDSIRFASIRSIRSFVRLAVTLARSVGTMSRERGDGGTTGANDDDESMDECLERLSRERLERTTSSLFLQRSRPTDRRPTIE